MLCKAAVRLKLLFIFLFFLSLWQAAALSYDRIVSLAPSITESLLDLGVDKELAAVTVYCDLPEGVEKKEIIGNLTNPNIEKIFSLSPDLVLAIEGVSQPRALAELESLGLKVITFKESGSFEDIVKNFYHLAELISRKEKAVEIINRVKKEIDLISKLTAGKQKLKVFWEAGAKPLVSISKKVFANDFIYFCGGENIFSDSIIKYPRVSREEVLKRNPQAIMLVTMGNVSAKEKDYWKGFKELEAVKNNRIYVIEADKVCRPTPLSFLEGLREVAKALRPDVLAKGESFE